MFAFLVELWACEDCGKERIWGIASHLETHTKQHGAILNCDPCKTTTKHTFVGRLESRDWKSYRFEAPFA